MNRIASRSSFIAAGLLLLLVLVMPASPRVAVAMQESVETLLGIIDERGLLTPVVSFDGVQWRSRWPEPDQKLADVTLPSSLAAVPRAWTGFPVPARWYAWPNGAAAVRPIQVTGPVRFEAHCIPGIGLQSDLPPPPRRTEPRAWPKKKQALAVSNGAVRVEPITQLRVTGEPAAVTPDALAERNLLRAAQAPFRLLARKAASQGGNPVKLAPWPVRWTNAWRYTLADLNEQVYLLEGRIDGEQSPGTVTGFLWLKARDGVLGAHRGHAVLDDEDFKMSTRHLPLGVVRLGGHHFWMSEQGAWEHEAYQLVDLTSPTFAEVLLANGGGC
jgi:hypothetical protein